MGSIPTTSRYCFDPALSIFVLSNHPEIDVSEVADVAIDAYR